MGLSLFSRSSCSTSSCRESPSTRSPNPNPRNFVIQKTEVHGPYVIVEVLYPNCTTFEGKKILVFRGVSRFEIHQARELDPHFCDHVHISPVARFVPTEQGWRYARAFCDALP